MSVPTSVADLFDEHVTFQTEGIDRMSLNVDVTFLQSGGGVSLFFREQRGEEKGGEWWVMARVKRSHGAGAKWQISRVNKRRSCREAEQQAIQLETV